MGWGEYTGTGGPSTWGGYSVRITRSPPRSDENQSLEGFPDPPVRHRNPPNRAGYRERGDLSRPQKVCGDLAPVQRIRGSANISGTTWPSPCPHVASVNVTGEQWGRRPTDKRVPDLFRAPPVRMAEAKLAVSRHAWVARARGARRLYKRIPRASTPLFSG